MSSAHEEGGLREYAINTKQFRGKDGHVTELVTARVEVKSVNGRPTFVEIEGTERVFEADLVLLAMGFSGPEKNALIQQFGVELDAAGNVKADSDRLTNVPKVYTAGDMARGQSLIVWAIAEGRHVAYSIDKALMGSSDLPRPMEHGNVNRPFG